MEGMIAVPAKFFYHDPNAPKPNRPTHLDCAVVIEYGTRVLVEQRSDSGLWSFIGGGLDMGETLQQCIRREICEETGLTVQNLDFLGVFSHPSRIAAYPDGTVLRVVTVAFVTSIGNAEGMGCGPESMQLCFVDKNDLLDLSMAATHWEIRDAYLAGVRGIVK